MTNSKPQDRNITDLIDVNLDGVLVQLAHIAERCKVEIQLTLTPYNAEEDTEEVTP